MGKQELDPDLRDLRHTLSERIKEARRTRGLTQGQLAEAMGVPRSLVNRLERGSRIRDVMTATSLFRVAKALGMKLKIEFVEEWEA
jgi:transcriptional regulator with XRE-family HTH domain